jgi:predicted AAA+ superfamily ATPase
MAMYRSVFSDLEQWKDGPKRKPLVMLGARQVGKTYALRTFGDKHFRDTAYINFEETPGARSFFERDLTPSRLLSELSVYFGRQLEPGHTLLILDEVQEAPRALTALKYFCEDLPAMHICAAGSLLGLKLPKGSSFPVGKVEFLKVFPMSFLEFLAARGEQRHEENLAEKPAADVHWFVWHRDGLSK